MCLRRGLSRPSSLRFLFILIDFAGNYRRTSRHSDVISAVRPHSKVFAQVGEDKPGLTARFQM